MTSPTPGLYFTSQSRMDFDAQELKAMGVRRVYATPFVTNNECMLPLEALKANLARLHEKAQACRGVGLEVYPFFLTIYHPEGNIEFPGRYRPQQNLDGSVRYPFVCFRDAVRQNEAIALAAYAAELGFERMYFDDDLRDAFCYCDEHLRGFEPFAGMARGEIAGIFEDPAATPEHEALRRQWYAYKGAGMREYAQRLAGAVHEINPACRIGICTSAQRCQQLSGRMPHEFAELFATEEAPTFIRVCGECYDDDLHHLVQSTGWHGFMLKCYPESWETAAEITSVTALQYRSPGAVMFETRAVLATAAVDAVHWAWTEDYPISGLERAIMDEHPELIEWRGRFSESAQSPIAVWVGPERGAYLPVGPDPQQTAPSDPIAAYNTLALTGLPVELTPVIEPYHRAVICAGPISREMIEELDRYAANGGTVILDAQAARYYRVFGGKAAFQIGGDTRGIRYEIGPADAREDWIAQLNAIYPVTCDAPEQSWQSHDLNGEPSGLTTVVMRRGEGWLAVLGMDVLAAERKLIRAEWRQRIIAILKATGTPAPPYVDSRPGVQALLHEAAIVLANYNTNPVSAIVHLSDQVQRVVEVGGRGFEVIARTAPD